MISDNCTMFQATANTIRQLRYSTSIRPTQPWYRADTQASLWERLIGHTKTSIKKVLITYDTLQTVITEEESLKNDRPLTYVRCSQPITTYSIVFVIRTTCNITSFTLLGKMQESRWHDVFVPIPQDNGPHQPNNQGL